MDKPKNVKKVEVWLYQTSEPLVFAAHSTYQKGDLFCVYDAVDGLVRKFPLQHIFRIVEGYGTHGGGGTVTNWRENE